MSRNRLAATTMTAEKAAGIVEHVVRERTRWGKHYRCDDIALDEVLDALIFAAQHDTQEVLDLRESLRKSQQQLGASKARETRLNKINAELRDGKSDRSTEDKEEV